MNCALPSEKVFSSKLSLKVIAKLLQKLKLSAAGVLKLARRMISDSTASMKAAGIPRYGRSVFFNVKKTVF